MPKEGGVRLAAWTDEAGKALSSTAFEAILVSSAIFGWLVHNSNVGHSSSN